MKELDPIFERLSDESLLTRCLQGLTQNQNESVNAQLWSKCSKTTFVGVRRVRIAVCETVTVFNTGAANKAVIMNLSGVNPGASMLKTLREQDKKRIKSAGQKVSLKYRKQRKNLRESGSRKERNHTLQGPLALIQSLKQQLSKERKLSPGKTVRCYHPQAERKMWRSQLQNPQAERNI